MPDSSRTFKGRCGLPWIWADVGHRETSEKSPGLEVLAEMVRVPATMPDDPSLSSGPMWWEERTHPLKLFSDLRGDAAHAPPK